MKKLIILICLVGCRAPLTKEDIASKSKEECAAYCLPHAWSYKPEMNGSHSWGCTCSGGGK